MLRFIGQYASPEALGAPDAASQCFKLYNLTVVHKNIYLGTVVFNVPGKYLGISRLEHQLFQPYLVDKGSRYIRSPGIGIFGNTFRLNHDHIGACLNKAFYLLDRKAGIEGALTLQLARGAITTGSELNTDFGFSLKSGLLHLLDQPQPVISRQRNKAGRQLDDVKAVILAGLYVLIYGIFALGKHIFHKAAGGYQRIVFMSDVNQLRYGFFGHQGKRTA